MQPLIVATNTSCDSINTEQQSCANVAECMADPKNLGTCMPCPASKYGAGCTKSCTAHYTYNSGCDGCEWGYTGEGFTDNTCSWYANCPAGYYWSDDSGCQACASDEFTPDITEVEYWGEEIESTGYASCQKCGANSTGIKRDNTSDSGGCECKLGYHVPNSREDDIETNTGEDCVPATYRIRIYKNRPWIENDNEYITLYVRYGKNGFAQGTPTDDNNRDSWFESTSKTNVVPNIDDGTNNRYQISQLTYNTPLQSAMDIEDVYEHAPRFYDRWDGKIFSHWSCHASTCDDTEIHPGDPIPEPNAPLLTNPINRSSERLRLRKVLQ